MLYVSIFLVVMSIEISVPIVYNVFNSKGNTTGTAESLPQTESHIPVKASTKDYSQEDSFRVVNSLPNQKPDGRTKEPKAFKSRTIYL